MRYALVIGIAAAAAVVSGCRDPSAPVVLTGNLEVSANVQGTLIDTVVVTVTAADIPRPIVANLTITSGVASGTLSVSAGSDRTITARAFDRNGIETHGGAVTVDVHPGTNPAASIPIAPLSGNQPVTLSFGALTVEVTPSVWTMGRGGTVLLRGTVFDPQGVVISRQLTWGSTNPARATVRPVGLRGFGAIRDTAQVRAGPSHGSVQIVAAFDGVSASAHFQIAAPIATGRALHTCGLAVDAGASVAYCWGANPWGQLGNGVSGGPVPAPTRVAGTEEFAVISTGADHTCAVNTSGVAHCWGEGIALGDGLGALYRATPGPVAGSDRFATITSGIGYSCGVRINGSATCWGLNSLGQLGDGTQDFAPVPNTVAGGLAFGSLSAYEHHTCGITIDGAAYCWGAGRGGQLGNGSLNDASVPTPVTNSLSFVQVTTGAFHSCGLTGSGTAYCWGDNTSGQLGDGSLNGTATPVPVTGGLQFTSLSAGRTHTCGVTTSGFGYCWGSNAQGTLGDGTITDRNVPTEVAGPSLISIAAGESSTCALAPDGAAFCWGRNHLGQLGDGTTTDRTMPRAVIGGLVFP